ncbi:MAG: hypothetical protein IT164_01405 [Bryobacterales bacterium]|nr:hypothetical protein [Bryobacterales bacterium]
MRRALSLCSLAVALGLAVPAGAAMMNWVDGQWNRVPNAADVVEDEASPRDLQYQGTLPGTAAWALAGAGVALLIPRKLLGGEPASYRSFEG